MKYVICIILFFTILACEREADWTYPDSTEKKLVVDGKITNTKRNHTIRLLLTSGNPNENFEPATEAEIYIAYADTTIILTESSPGIYHTDSFRAVSDYLYHAIAIYEEDTFVATDQMYPITPIQNPIFEASSDWAAFFTITDIPSITPAFYQVWADWSSLPDYDTISFESKSALLNYFTLSRYDITREFASDKEKYYFPLGTELVIHKYSISKEYENFIRSMLMETEWRGGIFDVLYGNVPTNFSNGALGFFSVSAELSDTLIVGQK